MGTIVPQMNKKEQFSKQEQRSQGTNVPLQEKERK